MTKAKIKQAMQKARENVSENYRKKNFMKMEKYMDQYERFKTALRYYRL